MAHYEFSVEMTVSEIVEIEANSYEEAYDAVEEKANDFYCVTPDGYRISWDNIGVNDYFIPEED